MRSVPETVFGGAQREKRAGMAGLSQSQCGCAIVRAEWSSEVSALRDTSGGSSVGGPLGTGDAGAGQRGGETGAGDELARNGARQYGLNWKTVALDFPGIYEVVRGDRAISADTAIRLGEIFRIASAILAQSSK